ncbi:hypothetical protein DAPPUDRAFT_105853 [Daphnia pulex]|uniref:Uncharacterized protein n=1 Tax=Daphnia pulex TaxID=6669 RepID=E9GS05_DAPPU|nr:hypothetical protein DAPPUDRAFT_105853 [Daphnia pulex]|eukprot:EFX77743.1 hypothetical protein DAPPUDRAFT_105853 [Daphnia pulex]
MNEVLGDVQSILMFLQDLYVRENGSLEPLLIPMDCQRSCVVCVDRLHHARDNQDQQRLDQEEEKNGEAKNDAVNSGIKLTDSEIVEEAEDITAEKKTPIPIPSNVNLQKERHVKLVMQWSRGWTHPQQRQPAKGKARKLSKRGWTHPQKLQPAKGKGSPPVLHIRRSRRSLHKTCHAVV